MKKPEGVACNWSARATLSATRWCLFKGYRGRWSWCRSQSDVLSRLRAERFRTCFLSCLKTWALFRSFRFFELPTWADIRNCPVDRPCFLLACVKRPLGKWSCRATWPEEGAHSVTQDCRKLGLHGVTSWRSITGHALSLLANPEPIIKCFDHDRGSSAHSVFQTPTWQQICSCVY